jgi:hypothetical protein
MFAYSFTILAVVAVCAKDAPTEDARRRRSPETRQAMIWREPEWLGRQADRFAFNIVNAARSVARFVVDVKALADGES